MQSSVSLKGCSVNITQQIIPNGSMHAYKPGRARVELKVRKPGLQKSPYLSIQGDFWRRSAFLQSGSQILLIDHSVMIVYIQQINKNLDWWLKRYRMSNHNLEFKDYMLHILEERNDKILCCYDHVWYYEIRLWQTF